MEENNAIPYHKVGIPLFNVTSDLAPRSLQSAEKYEEINANRIIDFSPSRTHPRYLPSRH